MGSKGNRRGNAPGRKDATSRPIDTTGNQWVVVGWMMANIKIRLGVVQQVAAALDPAAFTDSDAAAAFVAIKRVIRGDAPSMARVLVEIRSETGGEVPQRIYDAVQENAGFPDEQVLTKASENVRNPLIDRRISDVASDLKDGRISVDDGMRLLAELKAERDRPFLDCAVAEDDTDALAVSQRWAEAEEERVIRTGFSFIDRRFGGGLPTGITAICAMPGIGKSALAAMLMLGALENDRSLRAIWFRGEMTDGQLWSRFLAAWSSIRSPTVPKITSKEASKHTQAARKVNADLANAVGGRLSIIPPPLSSDRIAEAIDRHRPGILVVDYLQKISTPGVQDRRSEIDRVMSIVSDLTTKHDIATIVISSMAGSRTSMTDIGALTKESNRLDYDAHNYFALWSEKKDKDHDPRPTRLEIVKGRTGGEGNLDLWFSKTGLYFTPQAEDRFEDEASAAGRRSDFDAFTMEAGG